MRTEEMLIYFQKLIGKRIAIGIGRARKKGVIVDVKLLNGGRDYNTGVFVYFLKDESRTVETLKVNYNDVNKYVVI